MKSPCTRTTFFYTRNIVFMFADKSFINIIHIQLIFSRCYVQLIGDILTQFKSVWTCTVSVSFVTKLLSHYSMCSSLFNGYSIGYMSNVCCRTVALFYATLLIFFNCFPLYFIVVCQIDLFHGHHRSLSKHLSKSGFSSQILCCYCIAKEI